MKSTRSAGAPDDDEVEVEVDEELPDDEAEAAFPEDDDPVPDPFDEHATASEAIPSVNTKMRMATNVASARYGFKWLGSPRQRSALSNVSVCVTGLRPAFWTSTGCPPGRRQNGG